MVRRVRVSEKSWARASRESFQRLTQAPLKRVLTLKGTVYSDYVRIALAVAIAPAPTRTSGGVHIYE